MVEVGLFKLGDLQVSDFRKDKFASAFNCAGFCAAIERHHREFP